MEERLRTAFTDRGLVVLGGGGDGAAAVHLPLFAGAMHYWRVDRRSWLTCLRAMKTLGLHIVETYVPWGVHEVGDGGKTPVRFRWDGDRDLGAFLDAVHGLGMYAILRPGPHINAELTYFGFPARIVRNPELQARTARGTPVWMPTPPRMFPLPSYAADAFHAEVATWYRAVAEVVAPRLAPEGPVVALQIDNEAQMFFRLGAFDHDYHPDALAWWREHAGAPESGPDADVDANDALAPPRRWEVADAERCARWVQFKDVYVARALGRFAAALRAAGLGGVAFFHNLPPTDPTLCDLPRLERAIDGTVGVDFYHTRADYHVYRRRALYLAGSTATVPFAPEVGVGGPPWLPPMAAADQEIVTLGLLAAGIRGLSFFMTVDRDRWYGAPITCDGGLRDPAPWLARLLEILIEVDWPALRRRAPIAVVISRADARFGVASSLLDPVTPVIGEALELGRAGAAELARDEGAAEQRRWLAAVEDALALAQLPYALIDEHCPIERFAPHRVIVMPTLDRVDRLAWRRLHELATSGHVVVIGPWRPTRDEHDQPLGNAASLPRRAGLIRAGSLDDLEGLAEDLAGLAGDLADVWITAVGRDVDVSAFEEPSGTVRVVFVANRSERPLVADVLVPAGVHLRDPLAGDAMPPRDGDPGEDGIIVDVPLGPHQVRLLLVEPDGPRNR